MKITSLLTSCFNTKVVEPPKPERTRFSETLQGYLPSRNTAIKVALVGGAAIALALLAYQYSSVDQGERVLAATCNRSFFENRDVIRSLNSVCKDAVQGYCKTGFDGKPICLRDYLATNWTPFVHVEEYGQQILCAVDIVSKNCSKLAGQPTVKMLHGEVPTPFVFRINFERIPAKLPKDFPKHYQRALECFPGIFEQGKVLFKSHILCK